MDVRVLKGVLHAVQYGAGSKCKMHVYDEEENSEGVNVGTSWNAREVVTLPCDGYCTIHVRDCSFYGVLWMQFGRG